MNYPRIFERVYGAPLCITESAFLAMHAVLLPRMIGRVPMPTLADLAGPQPFTPVTPPRPAPVVGQQPNKLYGMAAPGIAVVPINGILARNVGPIEAAFCGMVSFDSIAKALDQACADPTVEQIIIPIDSPGGEVTGTPELAAKIAGIKQTVVAFTDGVMASAGIWLGSQADEVYCTPSAITGSIGICRAFLDNSAALEQQGMKMQIFTEGNYKAIGQPGYSLSDADIALIQSSVLYAYTMFADAVRAGRGDIAPLQQKSAECYRGQQGVDAGLVDDVVNDFNELVELMSV